MDGWMDDSNLDDGTSDDAGRLRTSTSKSILSHKQTNKQTMKEDDSINE
jgi:hypothetical protein